MEYPFNYFKTERQQSALTLKEVALLIGHRSGSSTSCYERGVRLPTLEVALALQVIFGRPPHSMFPMAYELAEEAVMLRALPLRDQLIGQDDPISHAKVQFLDHMAARPRPSASNV